MDHESVILGEIKEFKRATLDRLDRIEKKQDTFQDFRSRLIGMLILVSFIASYVVEKISRIFS